MNRIDGGKATDGHTLAATIGQRDRANWNVAWKLEKFHGEDRSQAPFEVIEGKGNLLMNAGIALMLDLLMAAGGTAFTNANSHIGVGDSSTAESAAHTDLQASTNKLRKAMEATYPSRSGQTVTWRSVFATGDANFAWNEWAIFNASSGGTMLNRKVAALGTKTSAASWQFTVTVTLS